MRTIEDYAPVSLDFRRLSSSLLTSTRFNAETNIRRFKNIIDQTQIIHEFLEAKISGCDFNYEECFQVNGNGRSRIIPPVDESCHIKAQLDLLNEICSEKYNVQNLSLRFTRSDRSIDNHIRKFLEEAFMPLIHFITDTLSKEMKALESQEKAITHVSQNIQANYGAVNAAGRDIHSANQVTLTVESKSLLEIIEKLLPTIDDVNISDEDKSNLKDDLETIKEQVETGNPKKTRLQKALRSIQTFLGKVGVSLAVKGITELDWVNFAKTLEGFIQSIH